MSRGIVRSSAADIDNIATYGHDLAGVLFAVAGIAVHGACPRRTPSGPWILSGSSVLQVPPWLIAPKTPVWAASIERGQTVSMKGAGGVWARRTRTRADRGNSSRITVPGPMARLGELKKPQLRRLVEGNDAVPERPMGEVRAAGTQTRGKSSTSRRTGCRNAFGQIPRFRHPGHC
jgi:hypothetical protein